MRAVVELHYKRLLLACVTFVLLICSFVLATIESDYISLWPSFCALTVVVITRRAFLGLLIGAYAGAVLLSGGSFLGSLAYLWTALFVPIFESDWKLSALLFTLILGGFVALIEASGGLRNLLELALGKARSSAKRVQLTALGFGLFVFFDGLANTMLIGRTMRSAVDRSGVSREKLAYLADATSSSVACIAFISTWIVFQLSMINEGFSQAGQTGRAYALFLESLPTNFYCWFTLLLVLISILRDFNPGSMQAAEKLASENLADDVPLGQTSGGHWLSAVLPIGVLTLSIPVIAYLIGGGSIWPIQLEGFATAYAKAEQYVPQILVAASVVASIVAAVFIWLSPSSAGQGRQAVSSVFLGGAREFVIPIGVLLAAWMLGAAIGELGAGALLAHLLDGNVSPSFLPVCIFVTGALISFSTGTSWGTIGVLMPLAIPLIFSLTDGQPIGDSHGLVVAAIGAVFSGAVFGDHCSPFSDTTIVSSIAAGVEPIDHVRTQLPFALIAATGAAVFGFIPLGLGIPAWLCLLVGGVFIVFIPSIWRLFYVHRN